MVVDQPRVSLRRQPPRRTLAYEELREYVDSFKTSSDRARWALYVVVVATVLIGVAHFNVQESSGAMQRLDVLYERAAKEGEAESDRNRTLRDEFHRQFVAHGILTSTPIPGVWIDTNDLGWVGGITLALLMLILVFCLAREHENLYLALYRVRSLCHGGKDHCDGRSEANLLYHALAMRVVVSFPPTLAKWHRHTYLDHVGVIFFVPPLVYGWMFWTNWHLVNENPQTADSYGIELKTVVVTQGLPFLVLLALSIHAFLLSRSMSIRWQSAFDRVNPHRRSAPQMTPLEWLSLTPRPNWTDQDKYQHFDLRRRTAARVVDSLRPTPSWLREVKVEKEVEIRGNRINKRERDFMVKGLVQAGEEAAEKKLRDTERLQRLDSFVPKKSVLNDNTWTVKGEWRYRVEKPTDPAG